MRIVLAMYPMYHHHVPWYNMCICNYRSNTLQSVSQFKVEFMISPLRPCQFWSFSVSPAGSCHHLSPVQYVCMYVPSCAVSLYCTVLLCSVPSHPAPIGSFPSLSDLSQAVLLSAELSCRLHVSPHTHTQL